MCALISTWTRLQRGSVWLFCTLCVLMDAARPFCRCCFFPSIISQYIIDNDDVLECNRAEPRPRRMQREDWVGGIFLRMETGVISSWSEPPHRGLWEGRCQGAPHSEQAASAGVHFLQRESVSGAAEHSATHTHTYLFQMLCLKLARHFAANYFPSEAPGTCMKLHTRCDGVPVTEALQLQILSLMNVKQPLREHLQLYTFKAWWIYQKVNEAERRCGGSLFSSCLNMRRFSSERRKKPQGRGADSTMGPEIPSSSGWSGGWRQRSVLFNLILFLNIQNSN